MPSTKHITVGIFVFANRQMFSRSTPPQGQNIHSQLKDHIASDLGFLVEESENWASVPYSALTLPSPKPPPGFLVGSRRMNSTGSDSSRSLNHQEHKAGRAWPPFTQGSHPASHTAGHLPSQVSSSSDQTPPGGLALDLLHLT